MSRPGRAPRADLAPFAPPLVEGELKAAIDRVTRAMLTADDDAIPELVAERRAMREELAATHVRERMAATVTGQSFQTRSLPQDRSDRE